MENRLVERATLLAEEMRASFPPVRVEAGEVLARQGDAGEKFFFVESGVLDIVVTSQEGLRLPVARLGPGSHFGEMSLLAGLPISADVVASEPSVLYGATAEEFDALMRRKPELVEYLAGELATRLKHTNEQLAAQQQRQAVLSKLISFRATTAFKGDLPSLTKRLSAAIEAAAQSEVPVLLVGEKGVGKKAMALQIHAGSVRREKAVIVVDCRELAQDKAHDLIFGDTEPEFVSRFADRLGYLQAADRGTLILANINLLKAELQEEVATFLHTSRADAPEARVDVRIIATVESGADSFEAARVGLAEPLAQALCAQEAIQLRPLRKRRRDIIPLAEHFLQQSAQLSGTPAKQFGEGAKRKLLTYEFHYENAEELRQVVNLGIDLAESEVIEAQHLFFGAGVGAEVPHIDLLRWPWLEAKVERGQLLTGAKILVALIFGAIVAACLILPASLPGRIANVMVWGLWWPALIVLSVLFGRVWCAVCPLSSGAEAAQHAHGRGLSPTNRLKDVGPVLALVGFAAIIWIEYISGMVHHPRYTAFLLIGLALVAGILGWLYQRHTWCRYLCPLGAMCASFSTSSAIRVLARREVCQASCAGNECYKGSDRAQGCPMFNHALFLNSGQYCKLCLECIRACPSQSPRLVVQLPLRDIWRSDLISTEVAPLTIVVGLMALLLAATSFIDSRWLAGHWWFTLSTIAVVLAGIVLRRLLSQAEKAEDNSSLFWWVRAVYAFAPAVAGLLFAFHVSSLPWLGEIYLNIAGLNWNFLEVSLLQVIQIAAVAFGGLFSVWALWRLCLQRFGMPLARSAFVFVPLAMLAAGYLVAGLILLA